MSFPHLAASECLVQRRRFASKRRYRRNQYADLLADYLATHDVLTHAEFVGEHVLEGRRVLLLRHDVDHDFETAMQMASWEHAHGLRATYAVLHTAWYYGEFWEGRYRHTAELVALCEGLANMGHEVVFHNNLVTLALQTGADPATVLHNELQFLRGLGLPALGTVTHGDRLCHQFNYGNFEIFVQAVKLDRGGPRTLATERGEVKLGALDYRQFGLTYEAYDIPRDIYITDSGGALRCMRNAPGRPCLIDRPGRGRAAEVVGVLTHPVWWNFDDTSESLSRGT
jgi:hypothetical protein